MLTTTAESLPDDLSWLLGPNEGCRVFIPMVDVVSDMPDQCLNRGERSTSHRLASQDPEPGFDHVHPRRTSRCEVEVDVRVEIQPCPNVRGGVRGRIIQDDVQLPPAVSSAQCLQESQEVRAIVGLGALAQDPPRCDFQGGIKAGESVSLIVMGVACG